MTSVIIEINNYKMTILSKTRVYEFYECRQDRTNVLQITFEFEVVIKRTSLKIHYLFFENSFFSLIFNVARTARVIWHLSIFYRGGRLLIRDHER